MPVTHRPQLESDFPKVVVPIPKEGTLMLLVMDVDGRSMVNSILVQSQQSDDSSLTVNYFPTLHMQGQGTATAKYGRSA